MGPGPEVVPEEAGPGDEISEEEAEVVLDLDDPPQSPEAPEVSPDVSTEGPEDAPNQFLPHELSSSQDSHSNNPTNSNLAGYQGTQQPINPNLMNDLSVRRNGIHTHDAHTQLVVTDVDLGYAILFLFRCELFRFHLMTSLCGAVSTKGHYHFGWYTA